MTFLRYLLALLALLALAGLAVGVRELARRSNTQVHRVNQ